SRAASLSDSRGRSASGPAPPWPSKPGSALHRCGSLPPENRSGAHSRRSGDRAHGSIRAPLARKAGARSRPPAGWQPVPPTRPRTLPERDRPPRQPRARARWLRLRQRPALRSRLRTSRWTHRPGEQCAEPRWVEEPLLPRALGADPGRSRQGPWEAGVGWARRGPSAAAQDRSAPPGARPPRAPLHAAYDFPHANLGDAGARAGPARPPHAPGAFSPDLRDAAGGRVVPATPGAALLERQRSALRASPRGT